MREHRIVRTVGNPAGYVSAVCALILLTSRPSNLPWFRYHTSGRCIFRTSQGTLLLTFARVTPPKPTRNSPPTPRQTATVTTVTSAPAPHPTLPPILPLLPTPAHTGEPVNNFEEVKPHHRQGYRAYAPPPPPPPPPPSSTINSDHTMSPPPPQKEVRNYLNSTEETLFMQVFVEEVGIWMDSMDPYKHFSRLLPFSSLNEPMLLNAFLACGARHMTLVNPAYHEDKALNYYDTATRLLLASLQNPNRDTEMCATTAVILNVYEIMSERALQRMNHIAGARALLKECRWSARTGGVGGACFWLNVSMELLSCLHFNWAVAWEPDEWGVDMDFNRYCEPGREELWAYRIIYVLAKIANFRAALPRQQQEAKTVTEQMYLNNETQKRYEEWKRLRDLCIAWDDHTPRSMHPMAYLHSYQTTIKSAFPEVWLVKRCAIVARLFYHTAMVLLAQMNPFMPRESDEMRDMEMTNSHLICGIAAHVKDRGVASVALRSLAIAAECLTVRREQEEVLEIFTKIKKETGWRVNFVYKELKEKWGWEAPDPPPQPSSLLQSSAMMHQSPTPPDQYAQYQRQHQHQQHQHQHQHQQQQHHQQQAQQQQQPQVRRLPQLVNPLMAVSDYTSNSHPYHPHYVSAPPQVERHHYI
ncbi:hypothetical protein C7212DRAFT_356811 [Tuber magnatum]|uniref:Transcription factor domain-containing protein n=1 Tax=Tuber magnatum TaxID=42249 RepID=A0A317STI8_9PEZI|nr:hypothetical protein C7212DRAFT_356811 [Tuber magnatum]